MGWEAACPCFHVELIMENHYLRKAFMFNQIRQQYIFFSYLIFQDRKPGDKIKRLVASSQSVSVVDLIDCLMQVLINYILSVCLRELPGPCFK